MCVFGEPGSHMSFYDGTLNREKLMEMIRQTDLPIVYTLGYAWKNPTTHRVTISKDAALCVVRR